MGLSRPQYRAWEITSAEVGRSLAFSSHIASDRPDVFADGWPQKFYGLADEGLMYGNPQRFVKLSKSGIQMKAVKEGWRIESLPQDQSWTKALLAIADAYGVVCKEESEGARVIRTVGEDEVDRIDRIECGAAVLRELVGLSEAM